MHILITIISFIVTIFVLVGFHEFGHFIVAKLFKVKVMRFSIGFGRPLCRWHDRQGTEYVWSAIPLGGYVKLLDTREGEIPVADQTRAFDKKPIYQRVLILLVGPCANFLLSLLIFWLVFSIGITYLKPVIDSVTVNSIAAQAGLKKGNEIVAIDERTTANWASIVMVLVSHYGEQHTFTLKVRDTIYKEAQLKTIKLNVANWQLDELKPDPLTSLGIVPYSAQHLPRDAQGKVQIPPALTNKYHYPMLLAWQPAWQETKAYVQFNLVLLRKLFTGALSWQSLGGPFSILQSSGLAAQHGFVTYLTFLAIFGISVGILNLLPIPGLDGSQIVYLLIEAISGKPVSMMVQIWAFRVGFILLCLFMAQLMANDILRLVQ